MSISPDNSIKLTKEAYRKNCLSNRFCNPKNLHLNLKNIRFTQLPRGLSNKLGHKIVKEALILCLREELSYNEKTKNKLFKYLDSIRRLKEKVKKIKKK